MRFFADYWSYLKVLPKNPSLYFFFLLILAGGHSPAGKFIAAVVLILIVPVFQMLFGQPVQKK